MPKDAGAMQQEKGFHNIVSDSEYRTYIYWEIVKHCYSVADNRKSLSSEEDFWTRLFHIFLVIEDLLFCEAILWI